ncbi:unnamed protein product [Protopolystoma xenopodis]|uniref:Uncharacterized protein n=1 Tax=Protopolystoma xenopodis TaxID=117903 RepID=A0A3S5BRF8_9PLAT|nr:unnamed protein product [Protopolystoma xenopodis]
MPLALNALEGAPIKEELSKVMLNNGRHLQAGSDKVEKPATSNLTEASQAARSYAASETELRPHEYSYCVVSCLVAFCLNCPLGAIALALSAHAHQLLLMPDPRQSFNHFSSRLDAQLGYPPEQIGTIRSNGATKTNNPFYQQRWMKAFDSAPNHLVSEADDANENEDEAAKRQSQTEELPERTRLKRGEISAIYTNDSHLKCSTLLPSTRGLKTMDNAPINPSVSEGVMGLQATGTDQLDGLDCLVGFEAANLDDLEAAVRRYEARQKLARRLGRVAMVLNVVGICVTMFSLIIVFFLLSQVGGDDDSAGANQAVVTGQRDKLNRVTCSSSKHEQIFEEAAWRKKE